MAWQDYREQGMQRLAHLADARRGFAQREYDKEQKRQKELVTREREQSLDNSRGMFGMLGTGAAIGSLAGPIGTGVGAGAGLLLGGLAEMRNRQKIKGGKSTLFGQFGDTFGRAPSMAELPAMASGAMGAYGAVSKAGMLAKAGQGGIAAANQMFSDQRAAREYENKNHSSAAEFEKRLNYQPTDLGRLGANSTQSKIEGMYGPGAYAQAQSQSQMGPPASMANPPPTPAMPGGTVDDSGLLEGMTEEQFNALPPHLQQRILALTMEQ